MPSRGCPVPPEGRRWGPAKRHCVNGFAGGPTVARCFGSVVIVTGATDTAACAADRKRAPYPGSPVAPCRAAGRFPWEVTCRGVVDGIAMVIHMTRREGRRVVGEAVFVEGYEAKENQWDIQRL